MKTKVLKYYVAAFYFCSTFVAFAQLPGAEDNTGGLESPEPAAPIDGYVWVLAAMGLVYVFLRLRALNQQGNNPQE